MEEVVHEALKYALSQEHFYEVIIRGFGCLILSVTAIDFCGGMYKYFRKDGLGVVKPSERSGGAGLDDFADKG